MPETDSYSNGATIVKINGDAIKRLRETQGLTQLYVATAIGVTTDTISRWENRRYPTIKKENALKLAQALEVPLEEILDADEPWSEEAAPEPELAEETRQPGPPLRQKAVAWGVAMLLLLAMLGLAWWLQTARPLPELTIKRWLPPHAPPGQSFPVLLEFSSSGEASFILKEELPPSCRALLGLPPFTALDQEQRVIKWIRKTGPTRIGFGYLTQTDRSLEPGRELRFTGSVLLRQGHGQSLAIGGDSQLQILPFHWADANRDQMIDDEEILSVYDLFSNMDDLEFGREQIEDIWAGSGYRWDPETNRYLVIP